MHSSILCIRPCVQTTTSAELKESLPHSRSYGTIHFVQKKAIQNGFCTIFSCLLLCDRARLSIRVCLAEPRRLFKASSITAVDWRCNQPEPQTPFTCLSPFRPNCPFSLRTCRSDGRNHTFFSFRKEVPWSSVLLLLIETRPRSPTCVGTQPFF